MNSNFRIAVLGGGPGGYIAALKAAQLGASVALVEKGPLGGTCLNAGCIPSKAILASAELLEHIRHAADMGIEVAGGVSANWDRIQSRKDRILQALRGGIKGLLAARKVTLFSGHGTLDGAGRISVGTPGGVTEQFSAEKVILATGSVPARIPGWPADAGIVCTSDEALHWKTLPKKLLIVGGGVIGCEFACMMQPLGVEVTMVEMLPQLLPNLDPQLAQLLQKILARRGVKMFTGVRIDDLTIADGQAEARLGNGRTITADRVLVATGRKPNTADIGLATAGITSDRGFVRVNDRMETSVKDHYCIGDANGRCLLAHAASAHGVVAAENALGATHEFNAPVPNCVYTFPEIASVGMTADEARAKGMAVSVGSFPLGHLGKAMAAGETEGLVKLVRDRESGQLIGVHMLGHNVTECIAAATAMMHQRASVQDVAEAVLAHPTISESIKEAAEDAMQMALHLPPRKILRVTADILPATVSPG